VASGFAGGIKAYADCKGDILCEYLIKSMYKLTSNSSNENKI